jgi:hypothetical protein
MALIALEGVTGCRRGVPTPVNVRGSVRVQRLLALHPAWSEVAELDQLISHVSRLPVSTSTPIAGAFPLSEAVFPRPLSAGITAPVSTPPPPAGSRRAAAGRIVRLKDSLEKHSERVVSREREAIGKRLEAESAVERSRIKAEEPPRIIARNPEDERELRKLEFQAIALESQVRVLFEPALSEAQEKLKVVAARIRELQVPPAVREEVQQAEIEKKVEQFRTKRRAQYEADLALRGAQVRDTARQAVAEYDKGLRDRLAEATPPSALAVPKTTPVPSVALPSPREVAASAFAAGAPPSLGTSARVAALRAQRARLIEVITEDISRRIQGMATQYHWTLAAAGGVDLTSRAADLLREQFSTSPRAGS